MSNGDADGFAATEATEQLNSFKEQTKQKVFDTLFWSLG